jgi:hypothetical protein
MPVFLVLLPLGMVASVWYPGATLWPRAVASFGVPAVLAWLLSQLGRLPSRQPKLWAGWGGPPTTQLLRHRNSAGNPALRQHYHERLKALEPSLALPTAEDEARDPAHADQVYEAATRLLIARTRDRKRFSLVFKENVNYGFRRNLWSMKPLGLTIAALGLVGCVWLVVSARMPIAKVKFDWWLATVINVGLLLCWAAWITPSWVRIAAQAYAERLLEACDQLEGRAD